MAIRKETTIYRYAGHCPECGVEQEGRDAPKADRVCDACRKEHVAEKFVAKRAFLKGATIIDFDGECYVGYDGHLGPCGITELTVVTEDRRTICITTRNGLWRGV